MKNIRIGFIGGGNMAEAMLHAILTKGLASTDRVMVSDISSKRRKYLTTRYGVSTTADNRELVREGEVVILAVKPHDLPQVLSDISGLAQEQIFLSIVAGSTLDSLKRGLKTEFVVRAMPNTPAQVGEGMTVWTATSALNAESLELVRRILTSLGREIYVQDEEYLTSATAISGSGPAYIFLVMEALIKIAQDIGLPSHIAREMVLQTVIGAGIYARESGQALDELRRRVTSPGGTTEAAIRVLEEAHIESIIGEAVRAAYARAKELGATSIQREDK